MTENRRGMLPSDLFRLKLVSDAQISPDGARVAFTVTRLDEDQDEYLSTIWIVPAAGGDPRQFTYGPKRDSSPRWSPDGRMLAFLSEREGKKRQVYVMPSDGGEPHRLTDLKLDCDEPVWSPDGSRIAFTARIGPEEPDEKEKEKSKPARVITSLRYKANDGGFIYDKRRHIFVVALDGTEPRHLTDGPGDDVKPTWSPDGSRFAFAGNEYALDMGRNNRVFVISPDGGEPRCLTAGLDRTCTPFNGAIGPMWSPDSRSIYFGADDQGDVPVYRVAADGDVPPERVVGGERQATGLSISADGRAIAYCAMNPVTPAEVYISNAGGSDQRQLTDLNRDLKDEVAFMMPERFRFDRDGFTLDGWVVKPANFEPGRRYPTLLNVHGGPATQYGHNFFDEFQVQAGAGYAVIYTNPRGSQGYGEAFTRAVRSDWGGGDYLDVMMGVDEALRRFDFIDPERLGVLGGSYGGFMTSWIVGHSHRFKAACSERAVNNTYTLFGTSDIGSFFSETQAGVQPWDDMQWFIDHSPLTYAKHITTPLLIMHAEDDLRCPMEQAEQLFTVMKKLRKDVLFVRFPDETHEMSRAGRPRHRRDRFGFILDWFAKYLQPSTVAVPAAAAAN